MTGFVLAAAVLVVATLLLLLRPWRRAPQAAAPASAGDINASVYRDQMLELDRDLAAGTLSAGDHAQARAELQRRLIDDVSGTPEAAAAPPFGMRRTAWALAVVLPLAAAGLYSWLGSPAALAPYAAKAPTSQDVEQMVAQLAARMEKDPSDPKGWVVLARSYRAMGRLPEAEAAFKRIGPALNENATLLAEYGDVLAARAMGNFDGKPMEIVNQALKIDPENPMAISLAATAAYNRNDFAGAVTHWEHLLKLVPPDSDDAKWLSEAVAKTRAQMAGPGGVVPVASTPADKTEQAVAKQPPAANASVSGKLTISPELAAKVQPTDTVFVFARNPQGSRIPLAVLRAKVSDLPLEFKLDDSMAMSPEFKLSSAAEVRIEARVSKTGSATPGPGDLIGVGPVVKPGAKQVAVQIDQVRP